MINGTGAYDAQGAFLRTRGYYVHPIIPGTKRPGYYVPSENRFVGMENWNHAQRPMEKSPQPGAGIGLRCGLQADGVTCIIAVDFDDEEIALAATEDPKLYGEVRKEGQRGFTAFFKSSKPVPSRDFKVGDRMVVQILSDGKQTVIPGSVHPDTGKPYAWGDPAHTLYQRNPCDVTDAAEDLVERIEALMPPGYVPPPDKPETNAADAYDDSDRFQTLNNAALLGLAKWVPDLGLYGLKRPPGRPGPYASYRAVASFRPSLSGKELKDRNLHLSMYHDGIKDFGETKGYSPIQLVMACLGLSFGEAVDWLRDRVLPRVDVAWDGLRSTHRHDAQPPAGAEEEKPENKPSGIIIRLDEWLARNLPKPDCILGHWLTTTSRVLLFAPTGIGKSMLAVAIGFRAAEGKPFMHWLGRRKATVLYVDAEMARRLLQERLADEVERSGTQPQGFHVFNHEDDDNFSPLNTPHWGSE
jgi:AAA domain/Bifunctional DNA primase/polymerase, N-terminal